MTAAPGPRSRRPRAAANYGPQRGTTYLIHIDPPYKHAKHYKGWTDRPVEQRFADHLAGRGALLTRLAVQAGSRLTLARVWPDTTKDREDSIKRQSGKRMCPSAGSSPRHRGWHPTSRPTRDRRPMWMADRDGQWNDGTPIIFDPDQTWEQARAIRAAMQIPEPGPAAQAELAALDELQRQWTNQEEQVGLRNAAARGAAGVRGRGKRTNGAARTARRTGCGRSPTNSTARWAARPDTSTSSPRSVRHGSGPGSARTSSGTPSSRRCRGPRASRSSTGQSERTLSRRRPPDWRARDAPGQAVLDNRDDAPTRAEPELQRRLRSRSRAGPLDDGIARLAERRARRVTAAACESSYQADGGGSDPAPGRHMARVRWRLAVRGLASPSSARGDSRPPPRPRTRGGHGEPGRGVRGAPGGRWA